MKEIIEFLLGYPTWAKIIVLMLMLAVVIILLFFHPVSAKPSNHGNNDSFVALLKVRADIIDSNLDEAIEALNQATSNDLVRAQAVKTQLETLKQQFELLHKSHIEAIENADIPLSHELDGEIHDVITQMAKLIDSRVGEIGDHWHGSLSRRYLQSPEWGQDPAYDSVQQNIVELRKATVDRLNSVAYPAEPPRGSAQ